MKNGVTTAALLCAIMLVRSAFAQAPPDAADQTPLDSNETASAGQQAQIGTPSLAIGVNPNIVAQESAGQTHLQVPPFLGQLQVNLSGGLRYDSNANQAINSYLPAQPIQVGSPSLTRAQADVSLVSKIGVTDVLRIERWPDSHWDTAINVSDQRFLHLSHNYDLTVTEADTGPHLRVAQVGDTALSVRPFGSLTWIGYGDNTYAWLYGGGVSAQARFPKAELTLLGLGQFGSYENSTFRPVTRPYTGGQWTLDLSLTYFLAADLTVSAAFLWYQADGQSASFRRNGPEATATIVKGFRFVQQSFQLIAIGSLQRLAYGGSPPGSDSLTRRVDTVLTADVSLKMPVRKLFSVTLEYQYLKDTSNFFPFTDNAITLGVGTSF